MRRNEEINFLSGAYEHSLFYCKIYGLLGNILNFPLHHGISYVQLCISNDCLGYIGIKIVLSNF